jgi:hypothetical protein
LKRVGLTPARFDLLYALNQYRNGVTQSGLRKLLGVGRTTVSRMLASLEQLRLVTRSIDTVDKRKRLVKLTTLGRWKVNFTYRAFARSGWADLAVDSALGSKGQFRWYDWGECLEATSLMDGLLGAIRKAFGDRARLVYDWWPDEIMPWEVQIDSDLEAMGY